MANTFLTGEWRKLIMANYAVNPAILQKYLPKHTELDLYQGVCYVSLVGFMFLKTKLKGIPIPFHGNFEEVNLRFYVKHKDENGQFKRGVVFIKEIVPKFALSWVANIVYNEPYVTMPTKHDWVVSADEIVVNYGWKHKKIWMSMEVTAENKLVKIGSNSEEEFITEHYWGYTKINENKTSEFGVEHPRWQTYPIKSYSINANFEALYGDEFAFLNNQKPNSILLAEGSAIAVKDGKTLRNPQS
jgi:uncharacterized protein